MGNPNEPRVVTYEEIVSKGHTGPCRMSEEVGGAMAGVICSRCVEEVESKAAAPEPEPGGDEAAVKRVVAPELEPEGSRKRQESDDEAGLDGEKGAEEAEEASTKRLKVANHDACEVLTSIAALLQPTGPT